MTEVLVMAHGIRAADLLDGQWGANDIESIERRLFSDFVLIDVKGEVLGCDVEHQVLGHPLLVDDPPDAHADLVAILQASVGDHLPHLLELRAGRLQQLTALGRTLCGECRIAAHHQTPAGEVLMGAFVEIDLIEEIHLDHPVIDQPTNRPALEGGDPADPVTTDAVIEGRITPVFSSETLAELQDVLARPRLQRFLTRAAIRPEALLARLALIADLVTPGTVTEHIRDPKDAPFVALVTTRPAPDLIVTGDSDFERDRYGGAPVVSASMLAAVLANQQGRIP